MTLTMQSLEAAADLSATYGAGNLASVGMRIIQQGFRGGNNLYPSNSATSMPYGKSTYSATDTVATNYAQGQHVMDTHRTSCYGVGDCLLGSHYLVASGRISRQRGRGGAPVRPADYGRHDAVCRHVRGGMHDRVAAGDAAR